MNGINFNLLDQKEDLLMDEAEEAYDSLDDIHEMLFYGLYGNEIPHIAARKLLEVEDIDLLILEADFDRKEVIAAFKKTGGGLQPNEKFKYYSRYGEVFFSIRGNLIFVSEYEDDLTEYIDYAFYRDRKDLPQRYLVTEDITDPCWILLALGKDYFLDYYFKAAIYGNSGSYSMSYAVLFLEENDYIPEMEKQLRETEEMKNMMVPEYADDLIVTTDEDNLFYKFEITGIKHLSALMKLDL